MPSLADYLLANTSGGNFGTMSPGEEAVAVTPGSVLDAMARRAATLPKRAFEASEGLRRGEGYDPGPAVETATMMLGAGGGPLAEEGALGVAGGRMRAPLAMDEASRTTRAAEQGFTREAYRGEGRPIEGEQFQLGHPERYDTGYLGGDAVYSTNAPRIANTYSFLKASKLMPEAEAQNVMPLRIKMDNPKTISGEDKKAVANLPQEERDAWLRDIYKQGHDGIIVKYSDGTEEYVARPEQYRSRFARYDPNSLGGTLLGSGNRRFAPIAVPATSDRQQ